MRTNRRRRVGDEKGWKANDTHIAISHTMTKHALAHRVRALSVTVALVKTPPGQAGVPEFISNMRPERGI